jgi:hypothetical protein
MRWFIRLTVLALAAFGAKTLYDRWYGAQASKPPAVPKPEPYLEEIRVEMEEVVAAPYDADLGIPAGS